MEEVFRMYAMSDGEPTGEPQELDPDHDEDFDDEDEEVETSSVLTSSDDDEGEEADARLADAVGGLVDAQAPRGDDEVGRVVHQRGQQPG